MKIGTIELPSTLRKLSTFK